MHSRNGSLGIGLITDGAVLLYGLWTIACNVTVFIGGSAANELTKIVLALGVGLSVCAVAVLRSPARRAAYVADVADEALLSTALPPRRLLVTLGAIASVTLLGHIVLPEDIASWLAWGGALTFAAVAAFEVLFVSRLEATSPQAEAAPRAESAWSFAGLHALALFCAAFSLLAVRPRSDDAFYINMGVGIAAHPERTLLLLQEMHGPPTATLPLQRMFVPYRVHSFEALGGYLSYLTGIEVTYIVHMGLATIASWLVPFALARLFGVLMLRGVIAAVALTILYYCIDGTAGRGFANQAFVRMFNGKGVMLTVALPLICAYGIRFGRRPSALRFMWLALAQICAVGLTSTAIWIAPTLAALSVIAALDKPWTRLPVIGGSVLSSAWVLSVGVWVASQISSPKAQKLEEEALQVSDVMSSLWNAGMSALKWATPQMLGDASSARALLGMTAFALIIAPSVLARRWLAAIAFVLVAVFANPFLSLTVTRAITGQGVYERVFWLLPVPMAVGLAGVGLYQLLKRTRGDLIAGVVTIAAVAAFLFVATDRLVLGRENNAVLRFPPVLKQSAFAIKVTREACAHTTPSTIVLAPESIAQTIVTMKGCGYPLMAGMRWMAAPLAEERRRNALVALVSGDVDMPADRFDKYAGWLREYGVGAVVSSPRAKANYGTRGLLRFVGFERVKKVDGHEIWLPLRSKTTRQLSRSAKAICSDYEPGTRVLASYSLLAALVDNGCTSVLPLTMLDRNAALSDDDRVLLESIVANKRSLSTYLHDRAVALLREQRVEVVVISRQLRKNASVKKLLADVGLVKRRSVGRFDVLDRPKPSPELPEPEPLLPLR